MMPEFGRFTGLPVDVRHVTLNTGILSLAAAGVETGAGGAGLAPPRRAPGLASCSS